MGLENIDLVGNSNQRTPCVLVLDTSASMEGAPIDELNAGLTELHSALNSDPYALTHVSLLIVKAGGDAEIMMDWVDATNFQPIPMRTNGMTPLGEALVLALDKIEEVKDYYRQNGIQYTRPWLFFMTDGAPTDDGQVWSEAVRRCREAETGKRAAIFPIGVGGSADLKKISEVCSRQTVILKGLNFREFFVWLSSSLGAASRTTPGTDVQLPSVDTWASVTS